MCRAHSIHEKADTGGEGRGVCQVICVNDLGFVVGLILVLNLV